MNPRKKSACTKLNVRARVERVFTVIKPRFCFTGVHYRGVTKSANRLFVTASLTNLYLAKTQLMRHRQASYSWRG